MEDVVSFLKEQKTQLYVSEVHLLQNIQQTFTGQEKVFSNLITRLGDSTLPYVIYFPLFMILHPKTAFQLLGAVCFSEWLNFVAKIYLLGDRPFWWIREHPELQLPQLNQTIWTCESSSGCPSHLLQMNAVVGYVIISFINEEFVNRSQFSETTKLIIRRNFWKFYGLFLLFLFITKSANASNFPHQCLIGVILAFYVVNKTYCNTDWLSWRAPKLILISIFLTLSALYVYESSKYLTGYPIDWSIRLASKWCNNPLRIKKDTSPLSRVMMFSGSSMGLAVSSKNSFPIRNNVDRIIRLVLTSVVFIFYCTFESFDTWSTNIHITYFLEYLTCFLSVGLYAESIPRISNFLLPKASIANKKK